MLRWEHLWLIIKSTKLGPLIVRNCGLFPSAQRPSIQECPSQQTRHPELRSDDVIKRWWQHDKSYEVATLLPMLILPFT